MDQHIDGLAALLVAIVMRELGAHPDKFEPLVGRELGDDDQDDSGRDTISRR